MDSRSLPSMPKTIGREEVRRLAAAGAQIVDVLPPEEYAHAHIVGAVSLPLKQLTPELDGRSTRYGSRSPCIP